MRQRRVKRIFCYALIIAVLLFLYNKWAELFKNENTSSPTTLHNLATVQPTARSVEIIKDKFRNLGVTKQHKVNTVTYKTTKQQSPKTTKTQRYPLRPGCTDYSVSRQQKERRLRSILLDTQGNSGRHRNVKRTGNSFSLNLRRQPAVLAEELDVYDDWWKAFTELADDLDGVKKDYHCPGKKARGNWWDCSSRQFIISKPCLVYSFGIDNDFRFDEAMAELECEVHSFDPSMEMEDYITENGVHFHRLGIGSHDNDKFQPVVNEYTFKVPNNTWKMRTLPSIMSSLGHKNRTLDILKLDIEGYEWTVLENIICENLIPQIKQLDIEFHIFPHFPSQDEYVKLLQVYQALWHLDFKRYQTSVHQLHRNKDKTHLQADAAFVNINYNRNQEI